MHTDDGDCAKKPCSQDGHCCHVLALKQGVPQRPHDEDEPETKKNFKFIV